MRGSQNLEFRGCVLEMEMFVVEGDIIYTNNLFTIW
jgi:hypothetical protein